MYSKNTVCLNGEFIPVENAAISIQDQGVLYGAGLFETIKVEKGFPVRGSLHVSRLFSSADALNIAITFNRDEIEQMLEKTARMNGLDKGALRLTLTAGSSKVMPSIFITTRELPYSEQSLEKGIKAGFSEIRKNKDSMLSRHKTLNYYENVIAKGYARKKGWNEALFLNQEGNITEGCTSNIFLVRNNKIITPGIDSGLLPGIIRGLIINSLSNSNSSVEERSVSPEELLSAHEIFATNSLIGIMPIVSIGNIVIGNGIPGPITRELNNSNILSK